MHELYELKDMLIDELKQYGDKKDMSSGSLEVVDKLSHAIKNICKIIEHCEEEQYSMADERGRTYYTRNSYARGRGRNARRDSMGRYSGNYSETGDLVNELHELMENSPDERTRQEFQRFIKKIEQM